MILTYNVTEKHDKKTLLTLLRKEMRLSAGMVRRLKAVQGIFVNGKPEYTNFIVSAGDVVTADIGSAEPECDIVAEEGEIDILYENEGLLAVNKPAGLIVHPTHSRYTGTLSNFVAGYLLKTTGSAVCHAVNRLDRDTSGVVLFSKNSHYKDLAGQALTDASKEYLALVCGEVKPEKGTIDAPIKRLEEMKLLRVISEDGQRAVTHYETVKTGEVDGFPVTLLRLRLETGRTHQIRVHTLSIGHPVLGDKMYFTEESAACSEKLGLTTQSLHAHTLSFTDPVTNCAVSIVASITRKEIEKIILKL